MPHAHYTVSGWILEERSVGEASAVLRLFTEEFGVIDVSAQSVRALASKLRYQLGRGRSGRFTVVRGRETWRLVGAEADTTAPLTIAQRAARERLLATVVRFVRGEAALPALYREFGAACQAVTVAPHLDTVTTLFQLRALHLLGYIPAVSGFASLLVPERYTEATLAAVQHAYPRITAVVDEALYHNHL